MLRKNGNKLAFQCSPNEVIAPLFFDFAPVCHGTAAHLGHRG